MYPSTLGRAWLVIGVGSVLLGCSSGPAADAHPAATVGPLPDGNVELQVPADVCREVLEWPSNTATPRRSYRQYTWDPSLRIRSMEDRGDTAFTGAVALAWRYADHGRTIAYVGYGGMSFQNDNRHDDYENAIDIRLSYPSQPDLMAPSTADVWMGYDYQNEYDLEGRLTAVTETPYGPGNSGIAPLHLVYHEDAAGRCDRIETAYSDGTKITTMSYDAGGRLETTVVIPPEAQADLVCATSTAINSYDTQGRLSAERTWCALTTNGAPDLTTTYAYGDDGTVAIESFDFINDTPNDTVPDGDGGTRWVTHSILTRSPGCATLDAAIGGPPDQRCRTLE
jgi:hypothetical protein